MTDSTFVNDFYMALKRQQAKGQVTLTSRNPQKKPHSKAPEVKNGVQAWIDQLVQPLFL